MQNESANDNNNFTNNTKATIQQHSSQLYSQSNITKEGVRNIKTVARFRPQSKQEQEMSEQGMGSQMAYFSSEDSVSLLLGEEKEVAFRLDRVYDPTTTQQQIYIDIGSESLHDILNGYNSTIFSYGQSGSGKTYTMYGELQDSEKQGIIPRACNQIFQQLLEISCNQDEDVDFMVQCSMLEIYKETLNDLLSLDKIDLKISETPRGVQVVGLTQMCIENQQELMELLEIGNENRIVKATRINEYSNRSHTIFTYEIFQRTSTFEKHGKLNLVDLAGSEKLGKSGSVGETLEEAKKINLSLSQLGNVIHALTKNEAGQHVPFRDSKLTRILQESLGGNYKTYLITTCSPHSSSKEETISTLKFATRAKTIKTRFKMNIQVLFFLLLNLISEFI